MQYKYRYRYSNKYTNVDTNTLKYSETKMPVRIPHQFCKLLLY